MTGLHKDDTSEFWRIIQTFLHLILGEIDAASRTDAASLTKDETDDAKTRLMKDFYFLTIDLSEILIFMETFNDFLEISTLNDFKEQISSLRWKNHMDDISGIEDFDLWRDHIELHMLENPAQKHKTPPPRTRRIGEIIRYGWTNGGDERATSIRELTEIMQDRKFAPGLMAQNAWDFIGLLLGTSGQRPDKYYLDSTIGELDRIKKILESAKHELLPDPTIKELERADRYYEGPIDESISKFLEYNIEFFDAFFARNPDIISPDHMTYSFEYYKEQIELMKRGAFSDAIGWDTFLLDLQHGDNPIDGIMRMDLKDLIDKHSKMMDGLMRRFALDPSAPKS